MPFTCLSDLLTGTAGSKLTGHHPDASVPPVVWDDFFTLYGLATLVFQAGGAGVQGPPSGLGFSRVDLSSYAPSQTITFSLSSSDASAAAISFFRRSDVTNSYIEVDWNYAGSAVTLSKIIAGAHTVLASQPFTFSAGTVYTCSVTLATSGGSTVVSVAINGVSVVAAGAATTISDAAVQSWGFLAFGATAAVKVGSLTIATPSATSLTVTGPGSITVGAASPAFTVATDGGLPAPDGGLVFTPSTTVFSGSSSPATVAFAAGDVSHTFTETATSAGSGTVAGSAPGVTVTGAPVTVAPVSTSGSTVTGVTVSPPTATIPVGSTQAFTATVTGTGSPSQSVTWSASAGSFSGSSFIPPALASSAQTITITASSVQDGSKSGTARVTIGGAVGNEALSVYYPTPSLSTIYFTVTKAPDQSWNGSAFETTSASNWSNYVLSGADQGGTGNYIANFPGGIASGTYSIYGYRRVGANAASADTLIGTQLDVTWDGSKITTDGGGSGPGLAGSGTTLEQARTSTLWGTTDRLAAANSLSDNVRGHLSLPRQGRAQHFWDGFEQLVTSYFDGAPVGASEALARLTEYATALNAQSEVANEIVALVAANPGSLQTIIQPTGNSARTVRTFP